MPLGDADIAAGVFFSDFGVPVQYGIQTARAILDAPGADAGFDGVSVSDVGYRLEMSATAFQPMPTTGARLTVSGSVYQVTSSNPVDDGAIVELRLRRI